MQNHMPMTAKRSKLKLEVEYQYGSRLGTGSSNISVVD